MLERIESDVRSVRDFTAYASHELRAPVALIRTETDLALQYERSNGEYRDAIGIIGSEAQRMSSLLDSLLFLTRADAGAEQVRLHSVDARRLCVQTCEKSRRIFQGANLELKADLPAGLVPVMADPTELQGLLTFILENASKYAPSGGSVRLVFRVAGGYAHFAVTDTGIGVLPGDKELIFARFRRGSNAQDAKFMARGWDWLLPRGSQNAIALQFKLRAPWVLEAPFPGLSPYHLSTGLKCPQSRLKPQMSTSHSHPRKYRNRRVHAAKPEQSCMAPSHYQTTSSR